MTLVCPPPRLLAILATLVAALLLCAPAQAQMPPNPPVDVAKPLSAKVIDYDVYTGRFEAVDEVELRARVSGYLDRVEFEDGAIVEKGDVLFVIDQRPFENAVKRAQASLASAEAGATLASLELDRATQLLERRVGTEQEVDRTQATLTQSQADVGVAQAELAIAELDLEFTTIRAPITGRISESTVDPGNLVVGGTTGTTMLAKIVSVDPINFVVTASEADYLRYSRAFQDGTRPSSREFRTPVAVRLMDEDSFAHEGAIDFVSNELDPNSGTVTARAVIENPDRIIVPGVFGRMRIAGSGEYDALLVPDEAVLSDQSAKILLTVDESGTVGVAVVELGPLYRGLRVIRKGLEPEMRVIVAGVQRARPGQTVTPQEVTLEFEE
ncbi:MAG: efflux RND transporter periplasmic adaptor subunit [Pseudomonadota bacterium]